ncbi:MAG: transketolase [Myxococcota bacterium]
MPSPHPHIDNLAVDTLRALAMDAVQAANSGHPGAPMALAPLGWTIFTRLRRHDPTSPDWAGRDRFVLSAGHASMLQYGLLHLTGYDVSLEDIKSFRQWGSKTPGHPEAGHTPGVEATTGPLGQGLAHSVGMALAARHLSARFDQPENALFDHHVFVIASDGDLMEGVTAEAASMAGHLSLGRLVVFWDDNKITIDGRTDISFTEDVLGRFEAYGWHTESVDDGNHMEAIEAAARKAMADPRPSLIRVRTQIGYPAPNKKDSPKAHGAPLGEEEVRLTKEVMGWPTDETFLVPEQMEEAKKSCIERGRQARAEWEARLEALRARNADVAGELERVLAGALPQGWSEELPRFPADPKGIATRQAGGKVLQAIARKLPEVVGGSADLAASNNTYIAGEADFSREQKGVPRNLHFGIREHAMASAVGGMALHKGVIPFSATFLAFADYMRPAMRLAALMNVPSRYVFTHDSIGLGEDGPTHQPVEHLASLRAIPNMTVIRPCDANETREAWKAALERKGPAALILTRQALPVLDRGTFASEEGLHRGAYVLAEAQAGKPQALLVATGSEVQIALEARERLQADGVPTRVVSMPCWELFAEQDAGYRAKVLPMDVPVRVVVEAGCRMGWERWVGSDAVFVTIDEFGQSAPASVLYEKLGLTTDRVVGLTRERLG